MSRTVPIATSGGSTIWGSAVTAATASSSAAIAGTTQRNVSSDSTQMSYVRTWRSEMDPYIAYSNASDASVTFSFTGVAVAYLATKKADRGLCVLVLDNTVPYTPDLYDASGYSQDQQVIWYSGTLPYGDHNVTISQLGPDSRLGYYPYLVTETWIEFVPTNPAAYVATEATPSPTPSVGFDNSSRGPDKAAIAGGVVGGVIACVLAGFLIYLWRREKIRQRRSDGMPVQKVKKAEGKMAIEDEPDTSSGGGHSNGGGYGGVYGAYGVPGGFDPYNNPYPYGYPHHPPLPPDHTAYASSLGPASAWGSPYSPPLHPYPYPHPPHSAGSAESAQPLTSAASAGGPPGSPGLPPPAGTSRGSYYDSAYHSGGGSERGQQAYPYHVQSQGSTAHSYPVPEI
ncbi:hypothetical protein JCM11251_003994 [Rhodosporidiobolus azoricus]